MLSYPKNVISLNCNLLVSNIIFFIKHYYLFYYFVMQTYKKVPFYQLVTEWYFICFPSCLSNRGYS